MGKFWTILPSLLPTIGAVFLAFAAHQYGEAAKGTLSIIQQLISIWGAGAVGAGALLTGVITQRSQVVSAKEELPTPADPGQTTEDHLLGLLAQEFAQKKDIRLTKIAELYAPVGPKKP